jgi:hypothetical protein
VHAGGTVAIEPGGTCLRAALETLAAATTIPPAVMDAVQYLTVRVP